MKSDLFSKQASLYSQFRPKYPASLFSFLADQCAEHKIAWDCACGNGQAALGLASHFAKIIGTDLSSEQINNAIQSPLIDYQVLKAEDRSNWPLSVRMQSTGERLRCE